MMILSPAKTLDLKPLIESDFVDNGHDGIPNLTVPSCDPMKTREVSDAMKRRSEKDLKDLLGLSANLGKTAHKVGVLPPKLCY